jgi:hypothetical protein
MRRSVCSSRGLSAARRPQMHRRRGTALASCMPAYLAFCHPPTATRSSLLSHDDELLL